MVVDVSAVAAAVGHVVKAVSDQVAMISVQMDRAVVATVRAARAVVSDRVAQERPAVSDEVATSVIVEAHTEVMAPAPVVLAHAMVCVVLEVALVVAAVSIATQVVAAAAVADSVQDHHVAASKQRAPFRTFKKFTKQMKEREERGIFYIISIYFIEKMKGYSNQAHVHYCAHGKQTTTITTITKYILFI